MPNYRICVMDGDGIGPEVIASARKVLETAAEACNLKLDYITAEFGAQSYKRYGVPLPKETVEKARSCNAVLCGPVATLEMPKNVRSAILTLREILDLYAHVRPFKSHPSIPSLKQNVDFVIVRENTEDSYVGMEFQLSAQADVACAIRLITRKACRRIVQAAFQLAKQKGYRKVTVVHKSNVFRLTDSILLSEFNEMAEDFRSIATDEMLVDNAAMQMILDPERFGVIVTTNLFGDILAEEAAALVGGLGVIPSAQLGDSLGLFSPAHGSAPDLAGKNIANPLAAVLSAKMMLEWLGVTHQDPSASNAARNIEKTLENMLESRAVTSDLGGSLKTSQMTDFLCESMRRDSKR